MKTLKEFLNRPGDDSVTIEKPLEKPDRSDKFTWKEGDLELVPDPDEKDHSDKFSWGPGDLEKVEDGK